MINKNTKRIQGARGKIGKGFSIKNPNQSLDKFYIYVWNKDSYYENRESTLKIRSEEQEAREKKSGYTYISGWKLLGREDEESTWDKVREHIQNQYAEEFQFDEVQEFLFNKKREMNEKIKQQLKQHHQHYQNLLKIAGIQEERNYSQVSTYKKKIKHLETVLKQQGKL